MIIKSMARKQPSFQQLLDYMRKESASPLSIYHNVYAHERLHSHELINEFVHNATLLPKRKNANALYHEIISFEHTDIPDQQLDEILIEIGETYLNERAPHQLAYGVIHKDTHKPHIHLCISANEIGEMGRKRLSKAQFASIQKNLETYVLERFPELEHRVIYTQDRHPEQLKTSSREQEQKRRTAEPSHKEQLKNRLHGLFELANSQTELEAHLHQAGYVLYTRGKNVGIIHQETGKKHRFTTLGVMEHYLSACERFESLKKTPAQATHTRTPLRDPPHPPHRETVAEPLEPLPPLEEVSSRRATETPERSQASTSATGKPQTVDPPTGEKTPMENTPHTPPLEEAIRRELEAEKAKHIEKARAEEEGMERATQQWENLTEQEREHFLKRPIVAIKKVFSKTPLTPIEKKTARPATQEKTPAPFQNTKKPYTLPETPQTKETKKPNTHSHDQTPERKSEKTQEKKRVSDRLSALNRLTKNKSKDQDRTR